MGCRSIAVSRMRREAMLVTVFAWAVAGGLGCGKSTSATSDSGAESGPAYMPPTGPFQPGNLDCNADASDWPMFGQNLCNTGSQGSAGGISPSTVGTLGMKWVYNAPGEISATPTVVGGSVYVPDWAGNITKLDANTGTVTWTKSIGDILKSAGVSSLKGFESRNAPLIAGGMVVFGALRGTTLATNPGASSYMMALDQDTGALKWSTLVETHEVAIIAGSPVTDGSTVYVGVSSNEEYAGFSQALGGPPYTCCTFRGSVVALDLMTGAIKWKTHTIADSIYYANDAGKLSGWAGAAIWSSTPALDRKRNQLYVTTGNNYHNIPSDADAGAADGNYVDSVVALDMTTGAIKWARSFPEGGADLFTATGGSGHDSDFGAGANLFTATINGVQKDVVGAGQKSGMYWALDADTGATLWSTQVGSGGHLGGIHWGTATDGTRIYVEDNFESTNMPFALGGTGSCAGQEVQTGTWAALDTSTGNIVWQLANPAAPAPVSGASCNGPVAVTNGVMFAGSMDTAGTMFALNAATGDVLWAFASGGTVYGGPAIVGGVVYWGSGYPNGSGARPLGFGTSSKKLYAFGLGLGDAGAGPYANSNDCGAPGDGGTE